MSASHRTVHPSGQKVPEHLSTNRRAGSREERIDQQMEDTFPASDPPSYSGGNHIIGAPSNRQSAAHSSDHPAVTEAERKVKQGAAATPHKY